MVQRNANIRKVPHNQFYLLKAKFFLIKLLDRIQKIIYTYMEKYVRNLYKIKTKKQIQVNSLLIFLGTYDFYGI